MKYTFLTISTILIAVSVLFALYIKQYNNPQHTISLQHKEIKNPSHRLDTIKSNQWYSNLYHSFPTQPIFTLPLAFTLSESGLGFSYPDIDTKADSIYGSYRNDFNVGIEGNLNAPTIEGVGDWLIQLRMKTSFGSTLSFFIARGIPFTTLTTNSDTFLITTPHAFQLFDNTKAITENEITTNTFRLSIENHIYNIASENPMQVYIQRGKIRVHNTKKITISLLPREDMHPVFTNLTGITLFDTKALPTISNDNLITTYTIDADKTPLIALYSHQYDFLTNKPTPLATYKTLRGDMVLINASTFSTSIPLIRPPTEYQATNQNAIIDQIRQDTKTYIGSSKPTSKGYFLGAWLGKGSNILLLAKAHGLTFEEQQLQQFLERELLSSMSYFTYDKKQKSIIERNPEFGNEKLNDHHFHYGYFIRVGAILVSLNPSFKERLTQTIFPELIADIATTERTSINYPYIRNFDIYEGHSWADGYANFADGNNQESSSEAIQTWYAIYLWSLVTKNQELETYALYLYNTEIQSTFYYWFGLNNMYKPPYKHAIASIVWGGKIDYATWFSAETNMKYGIQLLPFTPGSVYLGKLPRFEDYEKDFNASGGSLTKPWGDLFLMWKSFYEPHLAWEQRNTVKEFEGNNPRSLFLYYLYINQK